jgi:hypothetical protein
MLYQLSYAGRILFEYTPNPSVRFAGR